MEFIHDSSMSSRVLMHNYATMRIAVTLPVKDKLMHTVLTSSFKEF